VVEPRSGAYAVARVDGAGTLRAQIGDPPRAAAARCCRHLLAVGIGPCEPAIIRAVTFADAGDEKTHWRRRPGLSSATSTLCLARRRSRRLLCNRHVRTHNNRERNSDGDWAHVSHSLSSARKWTERHHTICGFYLRRTGLE